MKESATRALLLMGQEGPQQYHNQPEHWSCLASILRAADLGARVMTDDLTYLCPESLAQFDVVLNFSTRRVASPKQIAALVDAVHDGAGYVGLHAATGTFLDSPAYHALIGSWFARHPPIRSFTLEPVAPDHPVVAGVGAFAIEDELYELRDIVADIDVLAQAEGHPMVYVRRHGRGRICYIAPGHDHRSLGRPEYARLVHQAMAWAARRSGPAGERAMA